MYNIQPVFFGLSALDYANTLPPTWLEDLKIKLTEPTQAVEPTESSQSEQGTVTDDVNIRRVTRR